MATITKTPYGGYTLTKVAEAGGDETLRFEATLVKDGTPIAVVSNDGRGGCNFYRPLTDRSALDEFVQFAKQWNINSPFAGNEDEDALVDRLLTVAEMNRKRGVAFVIDNDDFWTTGAFRMAPATASQRAEVIASLASQGAGRNLRIWDKAAGDFVAV